MWGRMLDYYSDLAGRASTRSAGALGKCKLLLQCLCQRASLGVFNPAPHNPPSTPASGTRSQAISLRGNCSGRSEAFPLHMPHGAFEWCAKAGHKVGLPPLRSSRQGWSPVGAFHLAVPHKASPHSLHMPLGSSKFHEKEQCFAPGSSPQGVVLTV